MPTTNDAPTLHLELDHMELLGKEYELPPVSDSLEENAEEERERYDEQIFSALVSL